MIVRRGVGDREADRHAIEERRLGKAQPPAAKVVGHVERELELAGTHGIRREERLIGAPLGIRVDGAHARCPMLVERSEIDAHPGRGRAGRSVEDVRRERSHPVVTPPLWRRLRVAGAAADAR